MCSDQALKAGNLGSNPGIGAADFFMFTFYGQYLEKLIYNGWHIFWI